MKYKIDNEYYYNDIETQATIDEYVFDDYDGLGNFRIGMNFITVYDEESNRVVGSFMMTGYETKKGAVYKCIYVE